MTRELKKGRHTIVIVWMLF